MSVDFRANGRICKNAARGVSAGASPCVGPGWRWRQRQGLVVLFLSLAGALVHIEESMAKKEAAIARKEADLMNALQAQQKAAPTEMAAHQKTATHMKKKEVIEPSAPAPTPTPAPAPAGSAPASQPKSKPARKTRAKAVLPEGMKSHFVSAL